MSLFIHSFIGNILLASIYYISSETFCVYYLYQNVVVAQTQLSKPQCQAAASSFFKVFLAVFLDVFFSLASNQTSINLKM